MENLNLQLQTMEHTPTFGKFVVEPLERGFGVTLANPLRRILLSSLQGAAIAAVHIEGALHEFATIPGVREDATQLILNLGDLAFRLEDYSGAEAGPKMCRLDKRGEGVITGADVECPAGVEIVNPEAYIATLTDEKTQLSLEMMVERGKGYVLPGQHERYNGQIGVIPVGSAFSPVKKVNFALEPTRVGSRSDYERLILEIWTNGAVEPRAALQQAAAELQTYMSLFEEVSGVGAEPAQAVPAPAVSRGGIAAPDVRIEELDFSVRTYNCLKKANYQTVADLVNTSADELMNIRNLGQKSLKEVHEKLSNLGYGLSGVERLIAEGKTSEDDEEEE